jgi:hypothetical protein
LDGARGYQQEKKRVGGRGHLFFRDNALVLEIALVTQEKLIYCASRVLLDVPEALRLLGVWGLVCTQWADLSQSVMFLNESSFVTSKTSRMPMAFL